MSDTIPALPEVGIPDGAVPPANSYVMAVVHENIVHDIFYVDGQKAALLAASPVFVQIARGGAQLGDNYDPATGTFSTPEVQPAAE